MMAGLVKGERGVALVTVLALMALAVPLVVAALGLAGTLSTDSRVKTDMLKRQYCVMAGSEYALYRLVYDTAFMSGLTVGDPYHDSVTLNGITCDVTLVKLSDPQLNAPPPNADSSRRLQALKTVAPTAAVPDTPTTFTYTIVVENRDNEPEGLNKIYDGLPAGFSYVGGSTRGVTTREPSISGQLLTWNLNYLHLSLQPGESVSLMFDATASVAEGNYCNEAWVDPGGEKTSSGLTAKVRVGSPPTDLCGGEALSLTKTVTPGVVPAGVSTTFTYTITLQNTGDTALNISTAPPDFSIRDLLPPGFSYVAGSTSGDVTTADPQVTSWQGSYRLDWNLATGFEIPAGTTRSLSFQASATGLVPGKYTNQAWVYLDEFPYSIYTWPTAVVQVMGVFRTTSTDGENTIESEIWIGSDTYVVAKWGLTR